ncbi:MAG: cation:proton antiporter [Propioniciclava sp.]
MEATLLVFPIAALIGGWVAALVRLPPMIGFLAAGFVLNGLGFDWVAPLGEIADLGVTLLLFTIGLKFDVRILADKVVWASTVVHMLLAVLIGLGFFVPLMLLNAPLLEDESVSSLALISFGLSFSSTVFAMKLLQDRGQTRSFYGRVAVGILVLQDLAAVVFLSLTNDTSPTWWALLLVLLVPASWLFRRIWDRIGHDEMQVLFGIVMALVPGYALFTAVGLKGDLGALSMGLLLASHRSASELSRTLFSLKELFLVGFFLELGLLSSLSWLSVVLAVGLLVMLPLQTLLYVGLLRMTGMRTRTAVRTGLLLMNFSEFGLIVIAVGTDTGILDNDWLGIMAVAVGLSFALALVPNTKPGRLIARLEARLPDPPLAQLHPDDRPIEVGLADAVVLGIGRIGRSAYDSLEQDYGLRVLGIDVDVQRVESVRAEGRNVVLGDATDGDFWDRLNDTQTVGLAVLAMPFHGSNLEALAWLRASDFAGTVAAVALYDDQRDEVKAAGADVVLQLYDGAGDGLAERAAELAGITRLDEQ